MEWEGIASAAAARGVCRRVDASSFEFFSLITLPPCVFCMPKGQCAQLIYCKSLRCRAHSKSGAAPALGASALGVPRAVRGPFGLAPSTRLWRVSATLGYLTQSRRALPLRLLSSCQQRIQYSRKRYLPPQTALVSDDKTTKFTTDKQPAGQRRKRDATQCGPAKAARSRQIALCYAHVWGHRCVGAVGRGTGWRPNSARIRSGLALHAGNSRRPDEKGPAASARDDTTVAVCSGGGRRDHRQPCVRKGGPNFRLVRTVLTSNGRCGRPPL